MVEVGPSMEHDHGHSPADFAIVQLRGAAVQVPLRGAASLSLILMNPAPASHADYLLLRQERRRRWAGDVEQLRVMSSTTGYQDGDRETRHPDAGHPRRS